MMERSMIDVGRVYGRNPTYIKVRLQAEREVSAIDVRPPIYLRNFPFKRDAPMGEDYYRAAQSSGIINSLIVDRKATRNPTKNAVFYSILSKGFVYLGCNIMAMSASSKFLKANAFCFISLYFFRLVVCFCVEPPKHCLHPCSML
ncbi:hypothetical protein AVEN_62034-1 [Araneus ventricosus]|uniref:Uncharacterized protein n=1 Tax=Araneus ventricosus TaxID=182803 RepID=A0A4Y2LKV6_ARAVE|nr:hypothetical protein AVEN_62034-1 [Araneus ventricosus]